MVKELMHDPLFLAGKAEVATKDDLQDTQDLLDTLMAHRESCVGMAGNMIGVRKRIIAFLDESGRTPAYTVMLNPDDTPFGKSRRWWALPMKSVFTGVPKNHGLYPDKI